jgi:hypothetical protein
MSMKRFFISAVAMAAVVTAVPVGEHNPDQAVTRS